MNYQEIQTFIAILLRDTRIFKKRILNRFIDACLWTITTLYVSQSILPKFGVSPKFATFLIVGNIVAWAVFELTNNAGLLLSDLQGINSLSYYLTLPLSSTLLMIRIGIIDAYKSSIITAPMLLMSKFMLWDQVPLSQIHYTKFILCFIMTHLCFGFFGLFIASITPSLEHFSSIKMRILFPMWFIGCYQFTWDMLYQANPILAYINLLNPITYAMEGMRGAMPLQFKFLPFSFCISMLTLYTMLFAYVGIRQFKKRLDCL